MVKRRGMGLVAKKITVNKAGRLAATLAPAFFVFQHKIRNFAAQTWLERKFN